MIIDYSRVEDRYSLNLKPAYSKQKIRFQNFVVLLTYLTFISIISSYFRYLQAQNANIQLYSKFSGTINM